MEEQDERKGDEATDDSVEIPITVEGEESSDPEAAEDGVELEAGEASDASGESLGDESSVDELGEQDSSEAEDNPADEARVDDQTPTAEEALDDLYLDPDESDVEVVEPDEVELEPGDDVVEAEPIEEDAASDDEVDEPVDADVEEMEPEEVSAREEELQARIDELEGELEDVREERDKFQDKMMRAAADLDNFRKRAKRDKEELRKYGAKALVKDLLQTIDNLERALEHADSSEEKNIIEGVEMVLRQMHQVLEKHGIEAFESEGEEFNPEQHEAIQQIETPDHESGEILEQFQKGYFIHDRLLRPAMVSVAKKVEPSDEAEPDADDEPSGEEGPETADAEDAPTE